MENNTTKIALFLAGALLASIAFWGYSKAPLEKDISLPEFEEKVLSYINNELLDGSVVAEINSVAEESGLYLINLNVEENDFDLYATKDAKILFFQWDVVKEGSKPEATLGNFLMSNDEVCLENEKPVVYYFGSATCPYCEWQRPVISSVAEMFNDFIIFKDNTDKPDDYEVFSKYSDGAVPTIVIGCKYYRVGAGINSGEEEEKSNLTSLICDLTGNMPLSVCEAI